MHESDDVGRPVGVVVIDAQIAARDGVARWFAAENPPIEVLASGGRAETALKSPGDDADVVVLDPTGGPSAGWGEAAVRLLVGAGRTVVLYTGDRPSRVAARGAAAVVSKRSSAASLIRAVRGSVLRRGAAPVAGFAGSDACHVGLAPREVAALRAWFSSSSKRSAASSLEVSVKTLDTYVLRARLKYAAVGRAAPTKSDLLVRALEDNLITLDDLTDYEHARTARSRH